jgi:hypothetical protein
VNKDAQLTEVPYPIRSMTVIATARERLKDRRLFMVNDHAREIAEESKTLERDARGRLTTEGVAKLFSFPHAHSTERWLLRIAYESPGMLRDLGQAICNAHRQEGVDLVTDRPIALELVNAYEQCPALRPTLPEVREIFIARKKYRWPGDFYARRVLLSLRLPLRPAKRGAPKKVKKLAQ